jgi:hypothetical protein
MFSSQAALSPNARPQSAIGSSVFDNIPLTALALRQGGYDWTLLAYAVVLAAR